MSYKKDVNPHFQFKLINKLLAELKKFIIIYKDNFYHAQKPQKQDYNKGIKLKNYAFSNKISLNSKYIKTKQNQILEAKFFESFQVLCLIGK